MRSRAWHLPALRDAPVCVCLTEVAGARDTINGQRLTPCFGAGRTRAAAARRGRAEYIERWSGFFRGDEPLVRASYRDLGEHAIHPNDVMLLSSRQLEVLRPRWGARRGAPLFDETAPVAWTALLSLNTKQWKYLPAQLVWFGHPREAALAYGAADSNGAAAGRTLADATLRGLLEVVERDSVALWWYNRARRPRVALDHASDPLIHRLRGWFEALGRDVWVLDVTSDVGIPVVVAVSSLRTGKQHRILLGFGAHLDRERAVRRALVEMAQEAAIVHASDEQYLTLLTADRRWLRHGTLTNQPQLRPGAGDPMRLATNRWRQLGNGAILLRCRQLLARCGLEILVANQTRPGTGRQVVKVFVPGLRPWWPRFARGRLYEAPVVAGWRLRPHREATLNPTAIWF